jgi:hypothetical protein
MKQLTVPATRAFLVTSGAPWPLPAHIRCFYRCRTASLVCFNAAASGPATRTVAEDHRELGRPLFRLVCSATHLTLSQGCNRGRLCALRLPRLQHSVCRCSCEEARVSFPVLFKIWTLHGLFAHCHRLRVLDCARAGRRQSQLPAVPTFRFIPYSFVPPDSKATIVLTLCDPALDPGQVPFSRDILSDIFFHQDAEPESYRKRLMNESHFVRFNDELRSIRIPSLAIDVHARQITLDWRELCQAFLCDELKCRLNSKTLGSWSMRL